MKIERSKEWWMEKARLEGDSEVGVRPLTPEELQIRHVSVTDNERGPFVIIVTSFDDLKDPAYPMVIGPEGGYATKDEALEYIEAFAKRKTPYLNQHFSVVLRVSGEDFGRFCSWED